MNVTINGYVSYRCNGCRKSYTVESKACTFEEDTSPESEEDGYIRYLAQLDTPCVFCGNEMLINVDVWEYPEAVVNYSYYSVEGVSDVQCEFTIEHYFDDEAVKQEDIQYDTELEVADVDENDLDEEEYDNTSSAGEGYTDQYDHED